jgi:hypothetical protein
MSNDSKPKSQSQLPLTEEKGLRPITEEKGLQSAKNPPQMPKVKPPKSEKGS